MPGPERRADGVLALLLMVMPAIVLLVACLNLADLLLARGHIRRQELAIRSSLGGGRGRLTRQLLTEGCSSRWPAARVGCCCRRGRPTRCWRRCVLCSPSP